MFSMKFDCVANRAPLDPPLSCASSDPEMLSHALFTERADLQRFPGRTRGA